MVINQRPALKRDDSHIECVYFFFPWTELCYEFMVSFPFRTSQKNRRKADLSNLILNVGKQKEEKSRDFKTFSLLPFIALGIFSWNVTFLENSYSLCKNQLLESHFLLGAPLQFLCSIWHEASAILLWLIIYMSLPFRNGFVLNNNH